MEELRYCSFTSHHINIPAVDLYLLMFKSFLLVVAARNWFVTFFFPVIVRIDLIFYCSVIFSFPHLKKKKSGNVRDMGRK